MVAMTTAVDRFLQAMMERGCSDGSVRVYRSDLSLFRCWCESELGQSFELLELARSDLAGYRDHLQNAAGKTPATINRRIQVVRSFYRWAHREGLVKEDIGRSLRSMTVQRRARSRRLTRNEVNAFLRAAKASKRGLARRNQAILQVLLQTGVTAGELTRLLVGDVALRERKGLLHVRSDEGPGSRALPLDGEAREALRDYLHERDASKGGPLFLSERGIALTVAGLEKLVQTLARRAGVEQEGINLQAWRHTFARSWLDDHPGDLKGLQRLLGHEHLSSTAIYARTERSQ